MKIFMMCSKSFFASVDKIKKDLEDLGHIVLVPIWFDTPDLEQKVKQMGQKEFSSFKKEMMEKSRNTLKDIDSILVINNTKNNIENYIGGATFLEMYEAFKLWKGIYLFNDIPEGILYDEILSFNPIILNWDFKKIK